MSANKLEIDIEKRQSRLSRVSDVAKRPQVAFGLVIGIFWLIVLCTVSIWAPYDPLEAVDSRLLAPSMSHLLGTDALGRDVLTRVLFGARESMPIAAAVIICATVIGTLLGAVAGYVGGDGNGRTVPFATECSGEAPGGGSGSTSLICASTG